MKNHQTVLIIGFVWPEPNSSAAGNRMMQLAILLREQGWEITFASAASESEHMANLENAGIKRKAISLNTSDFDTYILQLNPTIVLFDRFMTEEQYGWRVAKQCPDALRMLDTEDLHCLRLAREKAIKKDRTFTPTDILQEETAKREIASIYRCDMSLMVSEFEMEILTGVFNMNRSLLFYLPIFAEKSVGELPTFEQRNDFMFIGNFLHNPNRDAVQYLKHTIWPLIHKQLPEAKLQIYGAYPSPQVLQWHNPKGHFYSNGRVENAAEAIGKSRVLLAPLRFGAGIKGKLLEAMACGTPSVTTTIGAESMQGNLTWNGFVSDDPQAIADSAVRLYTHKSLWQKAQADGFEIISKRYSKTDFAGIFIDRIAILRKNLKGHRDNNFIGGMLHHHTMRSTEYLSRWIEAKNR